MLVAYFAAEAAEALGSKPLEASPELLTLLANYHFPGNVRELRAMVVHAVARAKSGPVLAAKSFPKSVKKQVAAMPPGKPAPQNPAPGVDSRR